MSYSTPADVRAALVPRGTPAPDSGQHGRTAATMADPDLQGHINEADSKIDSYLSQRYGLPLTTPLPVIVKYTSRDIAAYLATLAFRKNKDLTNMDPVWLRYQDAIGWLKAVAAGQIVIPGLAGAVAPNATGMAGNPMNDYQGNLFGVNDFDLAQPLFNWPTASRERW